MWPTRPHQGVPQHGPPLPSRRLLACRMLPRGMRTIRLVDDAAWPSDNDFIRPPQCSASSSWQFPMATYSNKYPPELRERAIRMVAQTRSDYPSEGAAIAAVASTLGIRSPETLRRWVRAECSNKRCSKSKDPRCRGCKCDGDFHGSARPGFGQTPVPNRTAVQSAPPSQSKALRNVVLTVTLAAALIVGPLVISGALSGSSNGDNNFTVQVKIDLAKSLGALAAVLGLRSAPGANSGPSYHADCARSATREVKTFLHLNRCKHYATATRTVAKAGLTTQVAFSWVDMRSAALAAQYKAKVDTPKTGNPPGVSLAFNGFCYASGRQGETVWAVLVKPTGHVNTDREILRVAAPRKLTPTYVRRHCIA